MRSLFPDPSNPWPHDMVLTINNDSGDLHELLWLRQAWDLHPPETDAPPLLPDIALDPTAAARSDSEKEQLAVLWADSWNATLLHLGNPPTFNIHEALQATQNGSPERRQLLEQLAGPSWTDRFGDIDLGDDYQQWQTRQQHQRDAEHHLPLDQTPERRSLPALIRAWQRGLITIITIPTPGTHTRTVGPHALLLTDDTRASPPRYSEALDHFAPVTCGSSNTRTSTTRRILPVRSSG